MLSPARRIKGLGHLIELKMTMRNTLHYVAEPIEQATAIERHRISKSGGLQQDRCRPAGRTRAIRNYSLPATGVHEYAAGPNRSQGCSSFFLLFNFFQQKGETTVKYDAKGLDALADSAQGISARAQHDSHAP